MTGFDPLQPRMNAAMRLAEAGRIVEAAAAFRLLVAEAPAAIAPRRMLAMLLRQLGDLPAALAETDAAIAIAQDEAALRTLRADILLALGRPDAAADEARSALALSPLEAHAEFVLGFALTASGRWLEAIGPLENVLARQPDLVPARRALVRCLLQTDRADRALEMARHATLVDRAPEFAAALGDFAAAGASAQQADLLRARIDRHRDDIEAQVALASTLHGLGRIGDALATCEGALALRPGNRSAAAIRATALIDRGDVESGLAAYRTLLAQHDDAETAARHLVLMHYDPAQTNAVLFGHLERFAARHLRPFGAPFAARRNRDPDRMLRVGWLSPRFAEGPVASFLTGLLAAFDRENFRHLLIALRPGRDAARDRLAALADESIELAGLSDEHLLERLRALDLDVLIDLAGHSTANRIAVVSRRVAPVQVSWLDWFDTTAAPNVDAWISDRWLTPDDSTQRYTEQLVRLDAGRFCYTPPDNAPPPTRIGDDGEIVFASFNRLAKLNDGVLDAWAAILDRVPRSRLALGTRLLDDEPTRRHTIERFAARGIAADRLDLRGQRSYADLLAAYRGVDLALDPFPFSGCTTTCDALFMGVPVVTLPGETFVSRQSASLLERLGRGDGIATDPRDYVARAVALAGSVEATRGRREALRASVVERLCDTATQARDFEAAILKLWRAATG